MLLESVILLSRVASHMESGAIYIIRRSASVPEVFARMERASRPAQSALRYSVFLLSESGDRRYSQGWHLI